MLTDGAPEGGAWPFVGPIPCCTRGQHGYAVRVLPRR
jgi:hypothetical protein